VAGTHKPSQKREIPPEAKKQKVKMECVRGEIPKVKTKEDGHDRKFISVTKNQSMRKDNNPEKEETRKIKKRGGGKGGKRGREKKRRKRGRKGWEGKNASGGNATQRNSDSVPKMIVAETK